MQLRITLQFQNPCAKLMKSIFSILFRSDAPISEIFHFAETVSAFLKIHAFNYHFN